MYMCIMMLYLYVISWEQLETGNLVLHCTAPQRTWFAAEMTICNALLSGKFSYTFLNQIIAETHYKISPYFSNLDYVFNFAIITKLYYSIGLLFVSMSCKIYVVIIQ